MEPRAQEGTTYHYQKACVIIQESKENQPYSADMWLLGTPEAVERVFAEVVSRELEMAAIPQAQPALPNAA